MSRLIMDTNKVKSVGEDLKKIASDYNKIVNDLYKDIKDIPIKGAWTSANEDKGAVYNFLRAVQNEKNSTTSLGTNLDKLGNKIIGYSNDIHSTADNKL